MVKNTAYFILGGSCNFGGFLTEKLRELIIFINGVLLQYNNSYQLNKIFKMRTLVPHPQLQRQNTRRKALLEIHSYLRAVHVKDNPDLYRRLSELEGSAAQQQIMSVLRDSIAANSANPILHHFAFLLDRLLALPSFNAALHHHLPQIYCELFRDMLWQRNYAGLDELKVMRKYWVSRLSSQLYWQLHTLVMGYFQVDIERIPESAVSDLKKFYIDQLRMSYHDVYLHLPQLKQIEQQSEYNLNRNTHQVKANTVDSQQKGSFSSEIDPAKYKTTNHNGATAKNQKKAIQASEIQTLKRLRQQSQETTVSIKGSKKIKLEEIAHQSWRSQTGTWNNNLEYRRSKQVKGVQVKSVARQYNFLICHLCQFCHLKFELKEQLDHHLAQHKNPSKCQQQQQGQKQQKEQCSVTVRETEASNFTRTCRGCLREMELEYKSGDWSFQNCIQMTIYGQKIIVHKQCSEGLKQSYEQQVEVDAQLSN